MDKTPPSRYQRLLQWAAACKLTIPPETRVDPSLFPEENYPVFCPECDYLLRGLPDNRCPECGREFERGGLLVEQYVRESGKHSHPVSRRWALRTWRAGSLIMLLGFVPLLVTQWVDPQTVGIGGAAISDRFLWACIVATLSIWLFGIMLLGVTFVLGVRLAMISRRKRKQVLDASDHSHPGFVAAQRTLWMLPPMILGLGAGFAASEVLSLALGAPGAVTPLLHLVFSMVVGCGTTVGIALVSGCVRRSMKP
jgi:hypothetical protein